MTATNIQWADHVWNPVVGCTPVSAGCLNCYAATDAHRWAHPYKKGPKKGQPVRAECVGLTVKRDGRAVFNGTVKCLEERLAIPMRRKKPTTWFVNSVSDLFHEKVPFDFIDKVFAVMALCPQHTFQVLTKRPKRMAEYLVETGSLGHRIYQQVSAWLDEGTDGFFSDRSWNAAHDLAGQSCTGGRFDHTVWNTPLPNVWLGTSVEDQVAADERIHHLLRCPAAVLWLSLEPLLGEVDLKRVRSGSLCPQRPDHRVDVLRGGFWSNNLGFINHSDMQDSLIDWAVWGGESGCNARPCDIEHIRSGVRQCDEAGVPCFVKQIGSKPESCRTSHNPVPDMKWAWDDDPAEWPEDLRVQQMPKQLLEQRR